MRRPRGQRLPAEHLERLQQLVEVAHLDRVVVAQQRRERARRADDRARVGQRGPRRRLGAPDLEADDGLARFGRARQRRGEGIRAPDRLHEQPDGARALVLGQEGDEIRDVARELARRPRRPCDSRRAARGQERLADRARMRDAGDVARARTAPRPPTVPSHSDTPPGVATPMQFGPTTATSHSAARAPMRAATARPSAPASAPRPGSTTARTPAAMTSSKAASARVCPTSRYAHSGGSGQRAQRGEALAAEHGRAVGIHEPGRHAAVQHLLRDPPRSRPCGRWRRPLRASAGTAGGGSRRAIRTQSRDERAEPRLGLRRLQPAVMAELVLLEEAGLAPPGLDAGARQHDDVADALAEARRDARPEDSVGRELRRRARPTRRRRRAPSSSPSASSSAPSRTCRKRSRAEPAGASGRPSAPRRRSGTSCGQRSLT